MLYKNVLSYMWIKHTWRLIFFTFSLKTLFSNRHLEEQGHSICSIHIFLIFTSSLHFLASFSKPLPMDGARSRKSQEKKKEENNQLVGNNWGLGVLGHIDTHRVGSNGQLSTAQCFYYVNYYHAVSPPSSKVAASFVMAVPSPAVVRPRR